MLRPVRGCTWPNRALDVAAAGTLYVQSVPVGTLERFYRNTVEISENSENHLEAILGGRQVAGRDGFRGSAGKVAEKTQSEGKAAKQGRRGWQSAGASANYIDLRAGPCFLCCGRKSVGSPADDVRLGSEQFFGTVAVFISGLLICVTVEGERELLFGGGTGFWSFLEGGIEQAGMGDLFAC
jgi:hypothetical protein